MHLTSLYCSETYSVLDRTIRFKKYCQELHEGLHPSNSLRKEFKIVRLALGRHSIDPEHHTQAQLEFMSRICDENSEKRQNDALKVYFQSSGCIRSSEKPTCSPEKTCSRKEGCWMIFIPSAKHRAGKQNQQQKWYFFKS